MKQESIYNTIRVQIVSEKSTKDAVLNKYAFKVDKNATKKRVKNSIESIFEVKVLSVRVMNIKPKKRTFARRVGYIAGWKKAIVTIAQGQTINYATL